MNHSTFYTASRDYAETEILIYLNQTMYEILRGGFLENFTSACRRCLTVKVISEISNWLYDDLKEKPDKLVQIWGGLTYRKKVEEHFKNKNVAFICIDRKNSSYI